MVRKKLIWQLFPSYLVITLVALLVVTWYVSIALRQFYTQQMRYELTRSAHIIAQNMTQDGVLLSHEAVDRCCKELARAGDGRMRITVILPSGQVIGDSMEEASRMADHANRPEIMRALSQGVGDSLRPSPTLGINMMYVAIVLKGGAENIAVVRAAIAATDIDDALDTIRHNILLCGLAVAGAAAGVSLVISRRISRPIVAMERIAQAFSEGQLQQRVPIWSTTELQSLARALNTMACQLDERIQSMAGQRNELEAILSAMIEGVIAVDKDGQIVNVNRAAGALLGIDLDQVQGLPLEEVIRDVGLRDFVRQTLDDQQPHEGNLSLPIDGERFFHIHGARLPGHQQPRGGAVIVLHDITRIHRLESLRKDFVANVSHELKTPVTSIKGFVEALLDMGLDDPEQVQRYLETVFRHADRLNAIIDDLLTLSRLEEDTDRRDISFAVADLHAVAQSAIDLSAIKATGKSITVELLCTDSVEAKVNAALLEQALINLIDNAIKYSDEGGSVQVRIEQRGQQIQISVVDQGIGIPEQHQARLFERFYVVDKGRSRKLGGTGLGLAIVKHIANVHQGEVGVQSRLGKGSTFFISLPRIE